MTNSNSYQITPLGWNWVKLGKNCEHRSFEKIAELLPSKSISTEGDAEVSAITSACLSELGFRCEGIKRARMRSNDVLPCRVSPGEILVARSNTPELVGRASLFRGEVENVIASDLTIRILPKGGLDPFFLGMFFSFLYVSGYWKEKSGGASGTMKKITRSQILGLKIPIPPLSVQNQLARDFMDKTIKIKNLQRNWKTKIPC